MNDADLRVHVRKLIDRDFGGLQCDAAKAWGMTEQHLSDMLRGRRDLGPVLLRAIGYVRHVDYVREPLARYGKHA